MKIKINNIWVSKNFLKFGGAMATTTYIVDQPLLHQFLVLIVRRSY